MTEVLSVDLVNTGDYHFSKIYNSDWWSQSIDKIDKQLYAKYKLTQNEINVIESTIKEMR